MTTQRDAEFETLYRRHYARVYRFYRLQRVPDDVAHDLAQDVFTRAYRSFDHYRDGGWSFFETIARNVLYNWLRSQKAVKRNGVNVHLDDPDFAQQIAAPPSPDYADRDEAARNWKRFREAIAELPPGQRQCLELQADGLKYHQIAERMGITIDAVKTRLKDAKKRLRQKLGDIAWPDRLPEEDQ
jgi:RNA polymerase sigma factor (sigma-70 family)